MKLDQYRATLRRRITIFRLLWLAYLLMMVATRFAPAAVTEHPAYSGLFGFLAGGLLVGIVGTFRFSRALKDDTELRRLYNQEHDERMQAIRAKAGFPMTVFMGMGMIAAGLVATFFNMTVALTLIVAAVVQMLVSLGVKFWCMRTM